MVLIQMEKSVYLISIIKLLLSNEIKLQLGNCATFPIGLSEEMYAYLKKIETE